MKKKLNSINRKKRVRASIKNADRPRLSVFRSNKAIYAQIIDESGKIKASFASTGLKESDKKGKTKVEEAFLVGEAISQKAKKLKIKKVVFDRSEYRYHGRVKALADGARKGGLVF